MNSVLSLLALRDMIKQRERKPGDKWHLEEMSIKINGESFILLRAVDKQSIELDIFLQKHRNKKAPIRFLSCLLNSYPSPQMIVTDKLKSYVKPIKWMWPKTKHQSHKCLNNRIENAHQSTRRKEKCLIKAKSTSGTQRLLLLIGKVRNIFSVIVDLYKNKALDQWMAFAAAKALWCDATLSLLSI